MAKAVIKSGVCGFTTEVVAKGDMMCCSIAITTDCPSVQKVADALKEVEPMKEIGFRGKGPMAQRLFKEHCPHSACLVPAGIIKAVEVEARLALPKDASISVSR